MFEGFRGQLEYIVIHTRVYSFFVFYCLLVSLRSSIPVIVHAGRTSRPPIGTPKSDHHLSNHSKDLRDPNESPDLGPIALHTCH